MFTVAVMVGSLRRESVNLKLGRALAEIAGPRLEFRFIEMGDLPLYNDDLWADPPAPVLRFKAEVAACDAVLMLTPEYNRGVPAVLKNAFDWGTRPWGDNIWAGKPGAVGGSSPGGIGTAVAQSQLRNSLVVLGLLLMGRPELYFQARPETFDAAGRLADEGARKILADWVDSFEAWIARMAGSA